MSNLINFADKKLKEELERAKQKIKDLESLAYFAAIRECPVCGLVVQPGSATPLERCPTGCAKMMRVSERRIRKAMEVTIKQLEHKLAQLQAQTGGY